MTDSALGAPEPRHHPFVPAVHRAVARHHRLGSPQDAQRRSLLHGRPRRDVAAERPGARRRLHERGQLPRHRRPGGAVRVRRPHLLRRVPGRMADRDVPDRRAAAEPRTLHVHRRGRLPASPGADPDRRRRRVAGGRRLLPHRADGRRRQPDSPAVRHPVRGGGRHRRDGHARLRAVRRHDGDDVGADHQGRAAAGRSVAAGGAGAGALQLQSAGALRAGRDHLRPGGAGAGPAGDQSARRGVARPGAHARHGGAAAHPDAVLHGARREDGPDVGRLGGRLHRLFLPAHLHPWLRRHGDHRTRRDHRVRRRRQHGGAAPGGGGRRHAVSWASSRPWRLPRFSRSWRG